jgi:hypothetical protein
MIATRLAAKQRREIGIARTPRAWPGDGRVGYVLMPNLTKFAVERKCRVALRSIAKSYCAARRDPKKKGKQIIDPAPRAVLADLLSAEARP